MLISLLREHFTNVVKMVSPSPVKQGTIRVFTGKQGTEAHVR